MGMDTRLLSGDGMWPPFPSSLLPNHNLSNPNNTLKLSTTAPRPKPLHRRSFPLPPRPHSSVCQGCPPPRTLPAAAPRSGVLVVVYQPPLRPAATSSSTSQGNTHESSRVLVLVQSCEIQPPQHFSSRRSLRSHRLPPLKNPTAVQCRRPVSPPAV
ncbi:hypothetical protein PIB30_039294 [Stylosanthes scabra]|uniref:Uncharacterized protein n=1 Tax=Stylosanthes scabra TaxID=79078 RepID=A0ABU6YEN9_9FABA|nr:hypothetical protein [Stylosanthes scabra]